jgi:hypothetical protein
MIYYIYSNSYDESYFDDFSNSEGQINFLIVTFT